ncbi:broad specificity phosphatase PhoE [Nocardioides albertanoniae]|uniref:Broad specificity phosphatase PhoE n=1 Tax=Nocardioides albertanoniae TaxID=1175486 RepID=A0A543A5V0_9ACTN|nr:histidine phosphatase family protein [Nocardioides albertanoniae]TQL67866.1 broad specificity phosphatase PhoE [Nocardioides albertanoniae]
MSAKTSRGWSAGAAATTLVLVRHGVTKHTSSMAFSGGLGGDNPPLTQEGREQVRLSAEWLRPLASSVSTVITSPVRRTVETGDIVAGALDAELVEEPGFAELEFGEWDGLTFAEVVSRFPDEMKAWMGSSAVAPPGGESLADCHERVQDALTRVLAAHAGETVVVTTHVSPIKLLVAAALGAPPDGAFSMELAPASVTVVSYFADHRASMRLFNALPAARDPFAAGTF